MNFTNLEKQLLNPTRAQIAAAKAVIDARAEVDRVRPIVEEYTNRVLSENVFNNEETGGRITKKEDDWLMYADDFEMYLRFMYFERGKSGLVVSNPTNCPLLEAEDVLRKAKHKLIDEMFPATNISFDSLMYQFPDNYNRYIDLLLQLFKNFIK